MYFDIDASRPDTPRVPSALSRLEVVLLTLLAYALAVIGVLVAPASLFEPAPQPPVVMPQQEPVRFVHMEPLTERPAPPKPNVDQSDLDRRAMTTERAPKPENTAPLSRGNTPDKVVGAPDEKPAGPARPDPPAPPAATPPVAAPPDMAAKVLPDATPATRPAGGSLGQSLRNLQKYLQDQNLDNPRGGQQDTGASIQFDSKGVEFGPWLRQFVAQVKHNWMIPERAQFEQAHVVIQFNVQKSGAITDIQVVQPCPIDSLNLAAANALRMSNPTLPLPAEYPADKALFTVTFYYNEIVK